MLTVTNLTKNFAQGPRDTLHVLRNISLNIQPGEIVCLLGASGCGKTTLLRLIAGLEQADHGTIATSLTRPGREIGYLAQSDTLLPWRNIRDNAALGLELFGTSRIAARERAQNLLQRIGLGDFALHHPAQLSGGMRQRALLARLLVMQPKLLLLDEPMSALDVAARRDLSILLKNDIRARQAAALVVTHSVEEACFLADRILILTRRPAVIFREIRTDLPDLLDVTMQTLLQALVEPGTESVKATHAAA